MRNISGFVLYQFVVRNSVPFTFVMIRPPDESMSVALTKLTWHNAPELSINAAVELAVDDCKDTGRALVPRRNKYVVTV